MEGGGLSRGKILVGILEVTDSSGLKKTDLEWRGGSLREALPVT
jgi:hypothetical protein